MTTGWLEICDKPLGRSTPIRLAWPPAKRSWNEPIPAVTAARDLVKAILVLELGPTAAVGS